MSERIGLMFLVLGLSVVCGEADEVQWYGSGFVKRGGEAKGFPLEERELVTWSLRFEVDATDEKFPFGMQVPAQLSVAAGDRFWNFGNLKEDSTKLSVADRRGRDLVNFGFKRGREGEHFRGPGTEEIWTATFRIHGSEGMVSAETGRALSQAFFDWNSSHFRPFIALGFGDETYLWIDLLSLKSGAEEQQANLTEGMAEALRYAPAIRIRKQTAGEGGLRLILEYSATKSRYGSESGPVLEMSSDLVSWRTVDAVRYPPMIIDHGDGTETHRYEIIPDQSGEGPGRQFFRVRSH